MGGDLGPQKSPTADAIPICGLALGCPAVFCPSDDITCMEEKTLAFKAAAVAVKLLATA